MSFSCFHVSSINRLPPSKRCDSWTILVRKRVTDFAYVLTWNKRIFSNLVCRVSPHAPVNIYNNSEWCSFVPEIHSLRLTTGNNTEHLEFSTVKSELIYGGFNQRTFSVDHHCCFFIILNLPVYGAFKLYSPRIVISIPTLREVIGNSK